MDNECDLSKELYHHSYENGWSVDLNDGIFNKYYKIIIGYHHISNNYNRNIINKPK